MNNTIAGPSAQLWSAIDSEKRSDLVLRRVSIAAWGVTLVIVLLYGTLVGMQVAKAVQLQAVGLLQSDEVYARMIPFAVVLGVLSLLVATLSTIGMFFRSRAASLTEIQLRLSALETMLSSAPDQAPAP